MFELWHIDLDDPNPRLRSLFKYSFDEVNDEAVTAFHCRGSSHKEKINLNKALIIYILHGNQLMSWVKGNAELQHVDKGARVSNLYYMSDEVCYYLVTETKKDPVTRKRLEVSHVK